jgi:hypothetical protein
VKDNGTVHRKVYSVVYRPDIDAYYLYDRRGQRLLVDNDDLRPSDQYWFTFREDWNSDRAVAWAQFLESVEVDDEVEYFRQAEMGTGSMKDIISRVTAYWLDRGRTTLNIPPTMLDWSRRNMTDPGRHTDPEKISKLYTGKEAKAGLETVFARYVELVKNREFTNYGSFWPNDERIRILELRLGGMKFRDISKKMGRTVPACRAAYGRIRRGEDSVNVELSDWDVFREVLPLGSFPKREEAKTIGDSGEGNTNDTGRSI